MTKNWSLGAAALGLSVMLWLIVYPERAPTSAPVSFTASLTTTGLDSGKFVVMKVDPEVRFLATGNADQLQEARRAGVQAIVDLSAARAGESSYPVRLIPAWIEERLSARPLMTKVAIESLSRRKLDVRVETVGSLNDANLALAASPLVPKSVTAMGPSSLVTKLARAVVTLDLNTVNPSAPRETSLPVRLLDERGNIVDDDYLVVVPDTVEITPVLSLAPVDKSVVVTPDFRGQPAPGFVPGGYRITPDQVTVRGDQSLLAQLSRIATRPIDVSGAKRDVVKRVELRAPPGLRIQGDGTVTVRYIVRPG